MKRLLIATSIAGIVLVGCGQKQAPTTQTEVKVDTAAIVQSVAHSYLAATPENNRVVKPDWLMEKIKSGNTGDIVILDIRTDFDYADGHIPGAINIPFKTVANKENLAKLDKTKQIVVVCRTGHTASMTNAILNMLGYNAVTLKFGMKGWTEAQGPVEK